MTGSALGSVSWFSPQAACGVIAVAGASARALDMLKKTARGASFGADASSVNCVYSQKSGFCFTSTFMKFPKQRSLSICSVSHLLPFPCKAGWVCGRGFAAFPGPQGMQGQQQKLVWHREPRPRQ